ncbi:hypothetical protein QGM61_13045 [Pseudohongiella sp. SYSU M77423]|nr:MULTISPECIES: hypothetical protein [unclassified Pseudohongiella]MDH7944749.1 hypothetical protein [Pseudohongiella sp. SYSU M77423]MEC8860032.1 hypothetical protein [Pseudomonadota bacterium]MEC9086171.1 hypothetical protein [Pseudomonadota bacterium]|tara:strand:- start:753 stop:890 length:138 start_codon:yes stop_codon:yes gene_type:complete
MTEPAKLSTIEKIAVASSVFIIGAGIVYWGLQVQNVMELLEMAYG